MSTELVPYSPADIAAPDARWAMLQELVRAAEEADTAEEARAIMLKSKAIGDLLKLIQAPFDEAWQCGKASVLAARRLAELLASIPAEPIRKPTGYGCIPGPRGTIRRDLGISDSHMSSLTRLAEVPDPDFQRYIQSKDQIPSISGVLRCCRPKVRDAYPHGSWQRRRRRAAGVKKVKDPSLDECYSLIVHALGHITAESARAGSSAKKRALRQATDHLYAAEDLLKPYRGGYIK